MKNFMRKEAKKMGPFISLEKEAKRIPFRSKANFFKAKPAHPTGHAGQGRSSSPFLTLWSGPHNQLSSSLKGQ
jgi:hypothetical protein